MYSVAIYDSKRYDGWLTKFNQFIAIWFFLAPFYYLIRTVKIYGKGNIPKDKKPFIVMPNHLSNLDPPLMSTVLNVPIAWMAKKELYSVPLIGFLITILGAFSVDREKVGKITIKATKQILEKNWCLGIFLEGTRNKTPGILQNPNLGPAYISNLTNVPILPVGILGTNKRFGKITVRIGKLFYPDRDLETARWQCAEKLAELTGFKMPPRTDT